MTQATSRICVLTSLVVLLGCTQVIDAGSATYAAPAPAGDSLAVRSDQLANGDYFGAALALWGDELIVAAPGATLHAARSADGDTCGAIADVARGGRAFAFEWDGSEWSPGSELDRGPLAANDGRFELWPAMVWHMAVALSEHTLALGVPGMDYSSCAIDDAVTELLPNAGGVDVFERDRDGAFARLPRLTASRPQTSAAFGFSLARSGDWLFVGAPAENSRGPTGDDLALSGAVYAFERVDGRWTERQRLTAGNALRDAFFGFALAADGDTLVVGAIGDAHPERGINPEPEAEGRVAGSGAVYVFRAVDGAWQQEAFIKADNARARDAFGLSLAIEGDTLLIGALEAGTRPMPYADSAALRESDDEDYKLERAGAVYAYRRAADAWSLLAYFKAPEPQLGAGFGDSLAISGGRWLVGTATEGLDSSARDSNEDDSGAAYLFDEVTPGANPRRLRPEPLNKGAVFGWSVALNSHWAVLGGPGPDGDSQPGAVRVFDVSE